MTKQTSTNELSKRDELLRQAAEIARKYVQEIAERWVAPTKRDLDHLTRFREPFPNAPSDPMQILEKLDEIGSPATVATTGGRYFGFRHWRNPAIGSRGELAGGSLGSKCGVARDVASGDRVGRGGSALGLRGARSAREMRRGACDLRDDGEFYGAGGSTPGSSWRTQAGMSRMMACSERRPSTS